MNYTKQTYAWMSALLALFFFASCNVDTLEEVEKLEQVVSLVQVGDGNVTLKADNLIVDKENQMFRKGFGLSLSGFKTNTGFSADLILEYDGNLEGTIKLTPSECFLTASQNDMSPITNLTVPAGETQRIFYLNITRAALDAHEGQTVGVRLRAKNLNEYTLNKLDSVNITMNMGEFGSKKINITDRYFLNPTFKREEGTTTRFANLQDWTANDAVTKSRANGAGYDDNCGCMGIERWGSWDNPIINGKIYQTFELPKGRYMVEVDLRSVATERDTYLVVNKGSDLPDDTAIGTALSKVEITSEDARKLLALEFENEQTQQLSIGFLINIEHEQQRILQASAIRLFKLESFFD